MSLLNPLLHQNLHLHYPLFQAPLPFSVISPEMVGKISAHGALGLLRIGAHENLASLDEKVQQFQMAVNELQRSGQSALNKVCPSFCFAHPLPKAAKRLVKQERAWEVLSDYFDTVLDTPAVPASFNDLLDKALSYQPKALGFMHGMPSREILDKIHSKNVTSFVVCHSVAEALVADRSGVDMLILQGLEAGGERCGFQNDIERVELPALSLLHQVRRFSDKPLIMWGDFVTYYDMILALLAGASGVMLDRWFIACKDNDLPEIRRQQAFGANECQSALSQQFTHAPMRCIKSELTQTPILEAMGEEALFELGLSVHNAPLPLSLGEIEDPINLNTLIAHFQSAWQDYVVAE